MALAAGKTACGSAVLGFQDKIATIGPRSESLACLVVRRQNPGGVGARVSEADGRASNVFRIADFLLSHTSNGTAVAKGLEGAAPMAFRAGAPKVAGSADFSTGNLFLK
jgi:hypothetical protein